MGYDILKKIVWDEEKNQLLQLQRGISFELILDLIEKEKIVARLSHPNQTKYPNQEIFLFEIDGYIWYVPFVENENELFLKTIIPSRKYTKNYGGKS
jgi:uncharacterized DUF497 family protein